MIKSREDAVAGDARAGQYERKLSLCEGRTHVSGDLRVDSGRRDGSVVERVATVDTLDAHAMPVAGEQLGGAGFNQAARPGGGRMAIVSGVIGDLDQADVDHDISSSPRHSGTHDR